MEKGLKYGQMEASIMAFISKGRNMERDSFNGQMAPYTLESFLKMIFIIMELTNEQMEGSTKDSGTKIKWKDRDYSLGWTENLTKESTIMTRSKALESLCGLMAGSIKANGKMENRVEWDCLHQVRGWSEKGYERQGR